MCLEPIQELFHTIPFIIGTEAIISYYHDGMQIFDISNPSNVTQKAFYDTYPDNAVNNHAGFEGDWGVYPFYPSENIIASDITYGLFVLGKTHDVRIEGGDFEACMNSTVTIPYDIKGTFNSGNEFYLEFSDTNGYFIGVQRIDTLQSTSAGSFTTTLPSFLIPDHKYRVRVSSSSPAITDRSYIHLYVVNQEFITDSVSICSGDTFENRN